MTTKASILLDDDLLCHSNSSLLTQSRVMTPRKVIILFYKDKVEYSTIFFFTIMGNEVQETEISVLSSTGYVIYTADDSQWIIS